MRRDGKTTGYAHTVGGIDIEAFHKVINNKMAPFGANGSISTVYWLRTGHRERKQKLLTFRVSWIGLISQPRFGRRGTRYAYATRRSVNCVQSVYDIYAH